MRIATTVGGVVLFFVSSLVAAAESAAPRAQGLGQLLIQDAQSGSPVRLNVARYHVNVVLEPPVALVQIDQSFYNPFDSQQEGQFVFNLPRGASVSRFAMYVTPTQLIEGEVVERQRAAQVYTAIVTRRRDPAILEQIGDNLFKMRVFPIFARDEKRILLDFTVPIESVSGTTAFQLPLLSDVAPIWDFRITGVIRGPVQAGSAASGSHPEMAFKSRDGGSVAFQFQRRDYRPESDLTLRFTQPADRPASLRSYVAEPLPRKESPDAPPADEWTHRRATYFLAEIPPVVAPSPLPPTDVLLLADTSSSMRDLGAVRRAVRQVIEALRPQDRVRLAGVDVAVRPLHEGWLEPAQAAPALQRLEHEFCLGASDLEQGLFKALDSFDAQAGQRRRLVVYVGDGQHFVSGGNRPGVMSLVAAIQRAQATVAGIGVQREPLGAYLRSLAEASSGLWFDLAGDEMAGTELAQWLKAGMPAPLRIVSVWFTGAKVEDLYHPKVWLPGRPLFLYGRMAEGREVKLSLTLADGVKETKPSWTLTAPPGQDDVFVGRLWAQRRLEELRHSNNQTEVQKRIVALSQEWSLLSEYTAFLVLESEADYGRWGIDRLARRRYWKPADTRGDEPLPEAWRTAVTPKDRVRKVLPLEQQTMRQAQVALDTGEASRALRLLSTIDPASPAAVSPEFARLRNAAMERLGTQATAEAEGAYRRLLFPAAPGALGDLRPSLARLLGVAQRPDAEFLRRYPHADKLLQEVSAADLWPQRTLEEFVKELAQRTGLNVMLDPRALEEAGIPLDALMGWVRAPLPDPSADPSRPLPGLPPAGPRIALGSYIRHLLRPTGLVLVAESERLLITTREEAHDRLKMEVYPVADVLLSGGVAPLPLLSHPFLDREQAARIRIEAKLNRPITIDGEPRTLAEALAAVSRALGETVLCNRRELESAGVADDAKGTLKFRNAPAKEALAWLVRGSGLAYTICDEAVLVTSPEEADNNLEVRLYSGHGLVYQDTNPSVIPAWLGPVAPDAVPGPARRSHRRGIHGLGNGMGRGGFGMGGMGGMGGMFGGGAGGAALGGGMRAPASGGGSGAAPAVSAPAPDGTAGLSSGGPGGAAPAEPAGLPPGAEPVPGVPSGQPSAPPGFGGGGAAMADFDNWIDLITSTIAPQSWDSVGGEGSIEAFPPTLDYVVRQTPPIHAAIADLLERLRRLPVPYSKTGGMRPVTLAAVATATGPQELDFDTLIDLITSSIDPPQWSVVGGMGSIEAEPTRAALVVSQSAETHAKVDRLLTLLRRSRYEALRGDRPWSPIQGVAHAPLLCEQTAGGGGAPARLADYPPPRPDELEALRVRRDPASGAWQWRRVSTAGSAETITVRRAGTRREFRLPDGVVRIEDDVAAVAWPRLKLVELGLYAESLRRTIDACLPWLPHRSNEELARLFDVRTVPMNPPDNDALALRLVPAGMPPEGDTFLQIVYSRATGLPVAWESRVGGKPTGRIRFSAQAGESRAVLEDDAGRAVTRWESLATPHDAPAIPEPAAGWDGYLHLDRRAAKAAIDAPLAEALSAIRAADSPVAARHLSRLPAERTNLPLVHLLHAWCLDQSLPRAPNAGHELLDHLRAVMQSGIPELVEFVATGAFPSVTADELDALLPLQPEATRTAGDWERLAHAAASAGRYSEAVRHLDAALNPAVVGPRSPLDAAARECLRTRWLLQAGRGPEAAAAAETWATAHPAQSNTVAEMAVLLASHSQSAAAERLFQRALANEHLPVGERRGLLLRWADIRRGVPRCEKLLEAARLCPPGSPERPACLLRLLVELSTPVDAETAGRLAAEAKDAELTAALLLHQATLTRDARQAADLAAQVHKSGRLGEDRLAWACQTWNRAGDAARVIEACEAFLRAGKPLDATATQELSAAYAAAHRPQDARRAATRDPMPAATPPARPGGPPPSSPLGGFF